MRGLRATLNCDMGEVSCCAPCSSTLRVCVVAGAVVPWSMRTLEVVLRGWAGCTGMARAGASKYCSEGAGASPFPNLFPHFDHVVPVTVTICLSLACSRRID